MDLKSFSFKNSFLIDGNGNPPLKNGELLISGKSARAVKVLTIPKIIS